MPVSNRTARKTGLEIVPIFKHGVQRHVSAVTPTPNAHAISIDIRQRLQIRGAVALVRQLLCAEPVMNGLLKKMPASRRAAIIERKNNVALLRHQLMPEKSRALPFIH